MKALVDSETWRLLELREHPHRYVPFELGPEELLTMLSHKKKAMGHLSVGKVAELTKYAVREGITELERQSRC